ncbi:MAG TPA: single-stranded-DNA-specific exonuclease RecJ [Candidatus Ozemobacteraceae bacterium]|nr:single-stranded-DNA-specific exonuclease RecJ [Candidatus Ozemobacteraceae bacterium]
MIRHWKLIGTDEAGLEELGRRTGFPPLLLRILWNRGIREEGAIERYFEPRSRTLATPFLLDGVCPAVDRILSAIEKDESIRVYGDRDVDGITSTVLLLETLRKYTERADSTIPVIEDGYGLNRDYIDTAKRDGIGLIVTVDCGIGNVDEVEYAKQLGIDVVVTDHHEPPAVLPKAVALIDPKLPGSVYPHKDMAGVGVSLKLALAVELALGKGMTRPVIAFDLNGPEVDVLRFHPREGFTRLKHVNAGTMQSATILFYSPCEREQLFELLPELRKLPAGDGRTGQICLTTLAESAIPDVKEPGKQRMAEAFALPDRVTGAKRLVVMFLKLMEAQDSGVRTLWQRALDILTIGTVADMVPMRGENRTVAQMGLKFVANTRRQGLLELFTLLGWRQRTVTERDISFNIAPILNSSGRLRTAQIAVDLLTTDSPDRARTLAQELFELNIERKKLAEEGYRNVREHLLKQNDVSRDRLLLVAAPFPNQGVTGIVATRLMLEFCRPVIVLLEDHGRWLGSARSYKHVNMMNALHAGSAHLEKYGGHVGAAGLTVAQPNVEALRGSLRKYGDANITDADLQAEWLIDAEVSIDIVNETLLNDLMRFAPFGIDNPAPLFTARRVHFYEIRKVGETKNHLRFKFRKTSGSSIFGIGFGLGRLLDVDQMTDGVCDLVFSVDANEYNGVRSAQVVVYDVSFPGQRVLEPAEMPALVGSVAVEPEGMPT